ncbi:MAG: hypothetical protein A2Z77_02620 [Chloroflexi bacterium RBG_13_51_36]|nr:MAG: hypothetical protein A2Z77_02620 [Chloroflexi bacterium RBG_13_51_36]
MPMEDGPRNSGIDVIGSVPWGTHFCQFYRTKNDLIDILVPYFKAGLESNEFCMWVTSEPLVVAEAQEAMRKAVNDFDQYLRRGQIEIIPYNEWYLLGGTFDDDRVLEGWISKLEQALARGYSGLRLTGNTFWLERNHWQAFTEYEAKVNDVISKHRMIAACTYSLDKCDGAAVIDVVKNHQFALIKKEGKWDIIESAIYKQATEKIAYLASFPQLNPNPVLELDISGNIKYMNPATEALLPDLPPQGCQHPFLADWKLVLRTLREKERHTFTRDVRIGEFWYEQSYFLSPSTGDVRLYARDITERKRVEQALRESEKKFRTISDFTYDWEYWLSPDNTFIYVSPSCLSSTGYDVVEFMNDPELYLRVIHPDDRERMTEHLREDMRDREEVELEFRIIRRDGEERWIHHACQPVVDTDGSFLGRRGSNRDITDRKKMEEAMRETDRDLNRAQAVAHVGSWRLDIRRNQLLWSDETYRVFGVPGGTPMIYETFLSSVHPDDREYVNRKWAAALRGESYDIEHRIIVDDKVKWVRERAELELDSDGKLKGGFGTVQDVTERKQTEEALRETRNYLENLINYANAPIIVWNPKLEITRFNHAFEELTGRKADEVLGEKVDILIPSHNRAATLRMITRTTKKSERWEAVEIPIQHVDGSVRTVLWNSATLFDVDGKTSLATIAQGQDITERKKVEQLKDEFIGLVSHELRTPLTVISGSLHTAMSEGLSQEDARELLQNAAEGADSLEVILENMLELSRYQAGRLQLRVEMVSISDTAQNVIEKLKRQGIGHQFLIDVPRELPPVEADPVRVERILFNLMENAAKYSPEDGRIRVSSRTQGDFVVTRIIDRGPGISSEDQATIFEPFRQLQPSQRRPKGVGLGLVVCKRLVEAQGGWIKVDSKPGRGSTFSFALPRQGIRH